MDIGPVSITPSAPVTVTTGQAVNLQCSVAINPHPLPVGESTPVFEWFFGPTFNQLLTPTTNTNSGSTYTSTYSITSAMESDEGMYTCRLRGNQRTAVNTMVTFQQRECFHNSHLPLVVELDVFLTLGACAVGLCRVAIALPHVHSGTPKTRTYDTFRA